MPGRRKRCGPGSPRSTRPRRCSNRALRTSTRSTFLVADPYDAGAKAREIEKWRGRFAADGGGQATRHESVEAHCFTFDGAMDWTAFGVWMTMLLHRHGDRVLRIKGLLNVAGVPGPVLVNGVQHIVHPPAHLDAWPGADRRSHLVVILDGLAIDTVARSLEAFNAIANPAPAALGRGVEGKMRASAPFA